jgi:hypothetical protein
VVETPAVARHQDLLPSFTLPHDRAKQADLAFDKPLDRIQARADVMTSYPPTDLRQELAIGQRGNAGAVDQPGSTAVTVPRRHRQGAGAAGRLAGPAQAPTRQVQRYRLAQSLPRQRPHAA